MPSAVCHLNLARGFRGGERQTELLVRKLAERGLSQTLVARRGEPLLERLAGLPGVVLAPAGGNAISAALACGGAAVLHAHEARGAHAAFLRHCVTRQPYVLTRRVSNLPGTDGFTRRVYRRAARVACVARSVASGLQAYEHGLETVVIHSAVSELESDAARVAELRHRYRGRFLIGHVGALDNKTKGQIYIIRAARRLAERCPEAQVLLIGGGDDEAWLRREAADLDNVEFVGFVDRVGDYLGALDLFVLPSNIEGIGGILLDAMQFGLPVIATRVGGLPEIVRDGENGILVRPRSPDHLVEAIVRLHNSPGLRAAMGKRGREFVSGFTPAKMAERYLALYESVSGGSLA
jgi:glycosyltransferase involved in cell wall biosynthesis